MCPGLLGATAATATATRGLEPLDGSSVTVGDEIGKGRFKRVLRGTLNDKNVVILKYSKGSDSNELRILTLLSKRASMEGRSKHTPEIFGVVREKDSTSIVQELAVWGTLKSALQTEEIVSVITPLHKLYIAAQVAEAMMFLELERVVHADLSCRNVLLFSLEEDPRATDVKITDFGLSVVLQDGTDSIRRKQPQATRWCAPETVADMVLSHRTDVWALGTTLWEMFSNGSNPWISRKKRADVAERLREIAKKHSSDEGVAADFPVADGCPQSVHELILDCFQGDPADRPSFTQMSDALRIIIQEQEPEESIEDQPQEDTQEKEEKNEEEEEEVKQRNSDPQVSKVAVNDSENVDEAHVKIQTPSTVEDTPDRRKRDLGVPDKKVLLDESVADKRQSPKWQYEEEEGGDAYTARFKAMKAFLKSSCAAEVLGKETVLVMNQEIEEAQAREAYLFDLVKRMQAAPRSTPTSLRNTMTPHLPRPRSASSHPNLTRLQIDDTKLHQEPCLTPTQLTPNSLPLLPPSPLRPSSTRPSSTPPLFMASKVPSFDMCAASGQTSIVPSIAVPSEVFRPKPRALSAWTLWSFAGSNLQRQEFHMEAEAWAAFEATKISPCMLRDPTGAEVAARSWVASYFKLLSNGNHCPVSQGVPGWLSAPMSAPTRRSASVSPVRLVSCLAQVR